MTDAAGPILEIQRLSVGFAGYGGTTQVLHDIDLRVAAGQRTAIIGESGSGKTVTMKTVIGTLPQPAGRVLGGSIRFDGQELLNLGRRERERLKGTDISIVHQDPLSSFNPVFTIGDHLDDVLRFADRRLGTASTAADRRLRIEATLRQVQLKEPERVLRSHPFQLSGGMRQRVLIAMALMHRPKLLIADEPGTALDVTTQDEILRLLNQLVAEERLTLIMVTHNLAVVRQTADYVHVMQAGRIVEHGPVREIFQAPRMPYTRRLLEAIPPLYGPKVQHRQAQGTTPVITATDVVKRFTAPRRWLEPARPPVTAVLNATLTICRGDIFGIAGESGSGKTTVARMIIGLASPTSGRIEIDGRSIEAWRRDPAFRRRIQIVYQNPASSLNPKRTVAETLTVPLAFSGAETGRRQRAQRIRELLYRVELPANFAERYPHQLSGGQKQRVAIARALAVRPEIIVLDEPTSSLDVSVQKTVIDLLLRLRDELGLTYVFISHDLSLMRNFCNRIAVMFRGEICEQGETGAVFDDPRHPYTRALIASVPVLTEAEEQAKPHVTLEDRRAVLASTTQ
ncbi:MAG TPA: ABC transporter ATP-binding protein [Reyranella sp.]|nr:ABC transporter ATP-binding protein [Reyranella sp.]